MSADSLPLRWTLRGVAVRLPDEIDHANCEQVRIGLIDALDASPAVLVVDMRLTTYCCSEGSEPSVDAASYWSAFTTEHAGG